MVLIPVRDEAHWHDLRAKHIGGSEVAALFDEHPQVTKFELWHKKKGTFPETDLSGNSRVAWGQFLEPAIAKGVSELHGINIRKIRSYYSDDEIKGLGGSIDYEIISHPKGPGILEIKNTDWLIYQRWEDGQPPLNYQLQLQTYLYLTGRSWGAIAVLVGGNDVKYFEYERRDETIDIIKQEVKTFWDDIKNNKEPKPNFLSDANTIGVLYNTSVPGSFVDLSLDNRLPILLDEYTHAREQQKHFDNLMKSTKAEILTKIGKYEVVRCNDHKITSKIIPGSSYQVARAPYRGFRVTVKDG